MSTYLIDDSNIYHIHNGLDELGLILNLPRLPEESNGSYRNRLAEVYARPGNARYDGLLYAINRALGYEVQEMLTITVPAPVVPLENLINPIAIYPARVLLRSQILELWADEEKTASFSLRESEVDTLGKLVQAINNTGTFQAKLLNDNNSEIYSANLINADSWLWKLGEIIPASHVFTLQYSPIVPNTVVFEETAVFTHYMNNPTYPGEFFIDNVTGQVKTVIVPSGYSRITYQFGSSDLTLSMSPVVINDLNSIILRNWLFSKIERNVWDSPEERYSLDQPNDLMQGIIDELKQNCPNFWDGWKWDEGRWLPENY